MLELFAKEAAGEKVTEDISSITLKVRKLDDIEEEGRDIKKSRKYSQVKSKVSLNLKHQSLPDKSRNNSQTSVGDKTTRRQ